MEHYEVIVIGGGHAGCEAALAAARIGAKTALVTLKNSGFATMPCNPAVGGIAKSHLVFELDALGGEMARNTDYTGLQYRMLNTRRGPAVQATRVQSDKQAYPLRMKAVLGCQPGLDVIDSTARGILIQGGALAGIVTEDGPEIRGQTVVVTTGTFLKGRIHEGTTCTPGGRRGTVAAEHLSESFSSLGFHLGRLKTGTPPRLHKDSLNYSRMEIQPGLEPPPLMSWCGRREQVMSHMEQNQGDDPLEMFYVEHSNPGLRPWRLGSRQLVCHLTHTTPATHAIIRENLARSAMYNGAITATGVRYCPSIEDKIVKFADKESHHVFVEPEGRYTDRVYPNGLSNSLPCEVQEGMIHAIPGLEKAIFLDWGYAIEYDYLDPMQLTHSLESRLIENLFFAGQINGTTGYEEAAAQGFMAGVNAARKALGIAAITLSRSQAYIGVLIDDLVTKGVDEPYRMFTSRAERRLLLRQDNARFRMHDVAKEIGIVPNEVLNETDSYQKLIAEELTLLASTYHNGVSLAKRLRIPGTTFRDVRSSAATLPEEVQTQIEIQVKYEGYIAREQRLAERTVDAEKLKIPPEIDYHSIKAMRFEAREKLTRVRPESLGQASRVSGVNPSDITILAIMIKRYRESSGRLAMK